MLSKLLAALAALNRLLRLVEQYIAGRKNKEREQRIEDIEADPAGEFDSKFGGMRNHEAAPVPDNKANAEPDNNNQRRHNS